MQAKARGASDDRSETWARRMGDVDVRAMLGVLGAASAIVSQTEAVLRRSGADVRGNEWDVLVALSVRGEMRPSEILRHAPMATNPPTVHAIIGRLASRDLVEKRPHPDDARGVLVSLTSQGVELVQRMSPILDQKIINGFAGHYSEDELEMIADLTERI